MATGRVPTTANSPLTAKGDLFTYSTAPARLAVGLDGEQIVADSSTSTGLRYQAPVNANPVLNSAFQVWQRGTSVSVAANNQTFTSDRWMLGSGVNQACTVSRQTTSDTTNLPFIQYCARVQRNSGQTGTGGIGFTQSVETINSIPYVGKTVTFSFYARAGANYSATSGNLLFILRSGTGTDQNVTVSGFTGAASVASGTVQLTTTWQRFTGSGTVASSATQLAAIYEMTPTGTAGANDYFEVTGVQLEVGSVATPFKTYAGTIQGELAACQRYYWRASATAAGNVISGLNSAYANNGVVAVIPNPVTMRVKASSLDSASVEVTDWITATASNSVTVDGNSTPSFSVAIVGVAGTPLTQYRPYTLRANASTGYIGFSAEL
jgi:hypothetical protein